jgi:hypothetical protein
MNRTVEAYVALFFVVTLHILVFFPHLVPYLVPLPEPMGAVFLCLFSWFFGWVFALSAIRRRVKGSAKVAAAVSLIVLGLEAITLAAIGIGAMILRTFS